MAKKIITSTFTDLHEAIQYGGNVSFTDNFTYTGEEDFKYGVPVSQFPTVIQGNGYFIDGSNVARAFNLQDAGYSMSLENATIQSAVSWYYYDPHSTSTVVAAGSGGAIFNAGTFKSTDVDYLKDSAEYGGAIFNDETGKTEITGSSFISNIADTDGGAVYNAGEMTLTGSDFSSNKAQNNGAAAYNKGIATFGTNTFHKNYAYVNGGAISNDGDLTVQESSFEANTAKISGGAIYGVGEKLTVSNSTFTKNKAVTGGAITNDGTAEFTDVYFEGNRATVIGGALYIGGLFEGLTTIRYSIFNANTVKGDTISRGGAVFNDGKTMIENVTFLGNTSSKYGGAIYNDANGIMSISNSIFNGNKASKYGGAIFNVGTMTITDTAFTSEKDTIYSSNKDEDGKDHSILEFNGVISVAGNVFTSTTVKTTDGYELVMDISSYTKKNSTYILDDITKFATSNKFSINVNGAQANTTYKLAKNAYAMGNTLSFAIKVDGEEIIASIKPNESKRKSNTTYSLSYASDGSLQMSIVREDKLVVNENQTMTLDDSLYGLKSVDIKKYATLNSEFDISMGSGSPKFKLAKGAAANVKNILASNSSTSTEISVGETASLVVKEEISGAKKLSISKGGNVLSRGKYLGTMASDSISIGTNATAAFVGEMDLFAGKNSISLSKGATASFGAVVNLTTLTTGELTSLNMSSIVSSSTNSSVSTGKNSITEIQSISFGSGKDSLKIGTGASFVGSTLDFGSNKNTMSLSSRSSVTAGDILGVTTLTLSAGTAANTKKNTPALYTTLDAKNVVLSNMGNTVSLGKYSELVVRESLNGEASTSKIKMSDYSNLAISGGIFAGIDDITMGKNCILGLSDDLYRDFDSSVISKQGKDCAIVDLGNKTQAAAFNGFSKELADDVCASSDSEVSGGQNGWLSIDDGSSDNTKYFNDLADYFAIEDIAAQDLLGYGVKGDNIKVGVWVSSDGKTFEEDTALVIQSSGNTWSFKNAGIEVVDYRICVSLDSDKVTDGVVTYQVLGLA